MLGNGSGSAAGSTPESFTRSSTHVVVAKGPRTRVVAGGVAHAVLAGGPVLSRGGSGDLLAGLMGGLLAQSPDDPLRAAARGALWHALAADQFAQGRGEVAVATGDLLSYLSPALRTLGEVAHDASPVEVGVAAETDAPPDCGVAVAGRVEEVSVTAGVGAEELAG
jgi:hydroxyethylthiazole kinase-like sugar kinase family protein